jgi:phage antirepressor YoqD-like protein
MQWTSDEVKITIKKTSGATNNGDFNTTATTKVHGLGSGSTEQLKIGG